jgi:transcriptional regulator with XRE-family HTH domain
MGEDQEMDFHKRLGVLLAHLREEKGLSQEALAVQLQYDQSQISRIESGERHASLVYLLRWSEALNYPFDQVASRIAETWRPKDQ